MAADPSYENRFIRKLEADTQKANHYLMINMAFYAVLFILALFGVTLLIPEIEVSKFYIFSAIALVIVGLFVVTFQRRRWNMVSMARYIETITNHENLLRAACVGITRQDRLGFCDLIVQRAYEVTRRFRIPPPVPVRAFHAAQAWIRRRWYLLLLLLIPILLALFFWVRHPIFGTSPRENKQSQINDYPPKVVIKKPGQDIKASKIEEIEIEVDATDDFGLEKVSLNYSIGQQLEIEIPLLTADDEVAEKFVKTHILALEAFNQIEPGDIIAYHAKAVDNNANTGVSQIYFIEIRPFTDSIKKGQTGPDDGKADGGRMDEVVDELIDGQKRVTRKTWQLSQVSKPLPEDYESDVKEVGDEQNELKEQVGQVIAEIDEAMRTASVAPELLMNFESAQKKMGSSSNALSALDVKEALPHEKEALSDLIKAKLNMTKVMNHIQSANPQLSSELQSRMNELRTEFQNQREAREKGDSSKGPSRKSQARSRGDRDDQQGERSDKQDSVSQTAKPSESPSRQGKAPGQSSSGEPQGQETSPSQKGTPSDQGSKLKKQGPTGSSKGLTHPGDSQGQGTSESQKGTQTSKPSQSSQSMAAAQVQMNAQGLLKKIEQIEEKGNGASQTKGSQLKNLKQTLKTLANAGRSYPSPEAIGEAQGILSQFHQALKGNQKMSGLKMSQQERKGLEPITADLLNRLQQLKEAISQGGKQAGTGTSIHPDTGQAPATSTVGVEKYELPDIPGKPGGKGATRRNQDGAARMAPKQLDADELRPPGSPPYEYKELLKEK